MATLTVEEIINYLPHRYPMLLVDRVLDISDDRVVAVKNVTANEPCFAGHFPGKKLFPGVLVIEAMAQTGGILLARDEPGAIAALAMVDGAKFRAPVVPGDVLVLCAELKAKRLSLVSFRCHAKVGDKLVAEAVVSVSRITDAGAE